MKSLNRLKLFFAKLVVIVTDDQADHEKELLTGELGLNNFFPKFFQNNYFQCHYQITKSDSLKSCKALIEVKG